jgi:hypothetical protein
MVLIIKSFIVNSECDYDLLYMTFDYWEPG